MRLVVKMPEGGLDATAEYGPWIPVPPAPWTPLPVMTMLTEKPGRMVAPEQLNAVRELVCVANAPPHATPAAAAVLKFQPAGAVTVTAVMA